ncbi:ATP-binding protein [Flavobacterium sp. MXW15]|uniref:ATP-binding protein n=1 Tax=Xanthomonas chitinilytica TaxID=2989819 RepID=A0ABT3JWW7_9XANT|nr:ATP-binding protein [Xanthomonas sp. H13-6]MCW4455767.1 ATP-binding protein [Flavobacterium sp. MXW15]MCW4472983.1 ATP-binding protein [Xanthomonas sp. H13-6]
MRMRLRIAPALEQLAELTARLDAVLAEHGVAHERVGRVRLIVEELVCNAITHGHAAGGCELRLDLLLEQDALVLELRDAGPPFDPCQAAAPALEADAALRPIGGLGLYLVRQLADHIDYCRLDGQNRIRATLLRPFATLTPEPS